MPNIVIENSNLSFMDMENIVFTNAQLNNTGFQASTLAGAHFLLANLNGADFGGADLTKANLAGAKLINADLTDAVFTDSILKGTILDGTDLTKNL